MSNSSSIGEAKTNLSELVALAERGERVELRRRKPGALAGRITIAEDFDALPVDVERALGIRD